MCIFFHAVLPTSHTRPTPSVDVLAQPDTMVVVRSKSERLCQIKLGFALLASDTVRIEKAEGRLERVSAVPYRVWHEYVMQWVVRQYRAVIHQVA